MSFIPLPPADDDQREASPEDENLAPSDEETASDNSEPHASSRTSDDFSDSNPIELPLDPALADVLANLRETDLGPELPESFLPPTLDDVLDVSMSSGSNAVDPVAAFEQQSWQDTMDRLSDQAGPIDEAPPATRIQNFLGRRDAPHRIERGPLRPAGGFRASKTVQLSHRYPEASGTKPPDQQAVLDIEPSPSTSAASSAGDFPLASTPSQQPTGDDATKPLGQPRPVALVQLAEYEQFFLAEQDALIDRLTELARRIANEEIDHAAWVDYIHERAILGPH